jgi:signal recognition particle subunit SRP54
VVSVVATGALALHFTVVADLPHLPRLLPILLLQERANPQLLISSPSRRRRVAEGSGRSEQDVAELMGAFTQMKAQTSQMSKIMKLGQGERCLHVE